MKRILLVVAAMMLVAAAWVFEPWTAFTGSTVDEPAPAAGPASAAVKTVELAKGAFVSQEHGTSGTVRILKAPDGILTLRLEDFSTSNGPDLHVWLSDREAGGSWFKYDEGSRIELGELKGNKGNHNYEIPADTDLGQVTSVVIWCKRFHVAFGSAALEV